MTVSKKSIEGRLITRDNRSCNDPVFGVDLNHRKNHLPNLLRFLSIYGVEALGQLESYDIITVVDGKEKKESKQFDSAEMEFANYFIPVFLSPESQALLVQLKQTRYFRMTTQAVLDALTHYVQKELPPSIKTICDNYFDGKKEMQGIKQKIEAGYKLTVLDCRLLFLDQSKNDQQIYTLLRQRFQQKKSGFGKIDKTALGSIYSTAIGTGRKNDRLKIIASGETIRRALQGMAAPISSKTIKQALCTAFNVTTYEEFQTAYTNDEIKKKGSPAGHERIIKQIFDNDEFTLDADKLQDFHDRLEQKMEEWQVDHQLKELNCGEFFERLLEQGTGIKNSPDTKGHILNCVTEGWMSNFTQSGTKTLAALEMYHQCFNEMEKQAKEMEFIPLEFRTVIQIYLAFVQAPYLTYNAWSGSEELFEQMVNSITEGKAVEEVFAEAKTKCGNLSRCDKNLITPLLVWLQEHPEHLGNAYEWLGIINKYYDKQKRIDNIRWAHVVFPYDNPRFGWYSKTNCEGSITLPPDQLETLLGLLPDDKLSPAARRQLARRIRNTNNHHVIYNASFALANAEGKLELSSFHLISRHLTSHLLEQLVLAQTDNPDVALQPLVTSVLEDISFNPRHKTRELQWHNRGKNPFQSMYVSMVINSTEPDTFKNEPTVFFSFDINEPDVWGNVLTVSPEAGTFQIADRLYVTPQGIGEKVSFMEHHAHRGMINILADDLDNEQAIAALRGYMRRQDVDLNDRLGHFNNCFNANFGKEHGRAFTYSGGVSYYRACFAKEMCFFAQKIIDLGKRTLPVDILASLEERREYLLRKYNALVDERCRKQARAMLNRVMEHPAPINQKAVVLEKLELSQSFSNSRNRNKRISAMCYRRLINYVTVGAKALGIKVLAVSAAHTSICDTPSFIQGKKVPADHFRRVEINSIRTPWTMPPADARKATVPFLRKVLGGKKRTNKQTHESILAFLKKFYGTDSIEAAAQIIAQEEMQVIPMHGPLFVANGLEYLRPFVHRVNINGRLLELVPCDGHATINIGCRGVKMAYGKKIKATLPPA